MLRKTIFALSTAAALSAATLAPTSAFAGGGGGGGWHGGGFHGGGLGCVVRTDNFYNSSVLRCQGAPTQPSR